MTAATRIVPVGSVPAAPGASRAPMGAVPDSRIVPEAPAHPVLPAVPALHAQEITS